MIYKVVFHIDELDKWNLTLGNVKNLINEIEEIDSKVEVLVNSEAVKGYLLNSYSKDLEYLSLNNVVFKVCNNALRKNNISIDILPNFVVVVPAGVFELMRLQNEESYAYIKP